MASYVGWDQRCPSCVLGHAHSPNEHDREVAYAEWVRSWDSIEWAFGGAPRAARADARGSLHGLLRSALARLRRA